MNTALNVDAAVREIDKQSTKNFNHVYGMLHTSNNTTANTSSLNQTFQVSTLSDPITTGDVVGIKSDGNITKGFEDPSRYATDFPNS